MISWRQASPPRLFRRLKGFSIIEIIVVISLMVIFFSVGFVDIGHYKEEVGAVNISYSEKSIVNLINYGKEYCREKEASGYIVFDLVKNKIWFYCGLKRLSTYAFPEGVNLINTNIASNMMNIDNTGFSSSSGTITLKDNKGLIHQLTISVGTGNVEVKN